MTSHIKSTKANEMSNHPGADYSKLLTIKQFCVTFPWPSESAMRAYVYKAEDMGISDAFMRVGRRVLVAPEKFFMLIEKLSNKEGAR